MGHLISCFCYDYGKTEKQQKENKEMIEFESNEWAKYNSDSRSGLPNSINFNKSKVFDSYDEAAEYLKNHDGFYYQGAVLYKEFEKSANTKSEKIEKKIKVMNDKSKVQMIELGNYVSKNNVKNRKSVYVGCTKCGSKLHKDFIPLQKYSQNCPLCGENLFNDTVKARVKKYQDDIAATKKDLEKLYKELDESKKTGKYQLKWCVKVECHV